MGERFNFDAWRSVWPHLPVFTKLGKFVVAFLSKRGVRLVIYLDEFLIMNESENVVRTDLKSTLEILEALGFFVNWDKSFTTLTKTMEYLGMLVDSNYLFSTSHQSKRGTECVRKSFIWSPVARDCVFIEEFHMGHSVYPLRSVPLYEYAAFLHLQIEEGGRRFEHKMLSFAAN